MTESVLRASRAPSGLRWMVLASMAAHVLVGGLLIYAATFKSTKTQAPSHVLVTKLVRLGKKRPENLLPRVEEPPPATPPAPAPKEPTVQEAVTPKPVQNPVSAKKRIEELSRVSSALDRLKSNIGHEEGSAQGEVSNSALQVLGNQFATEVSRCMKQHYTVEGTDKTQVANLRTTVTIRMQRDGRIISVEVTKSSGSRRFDENVVRSAKRCSGVKPYPAIAETVRTDGLDVEFVGGDVP